ncbi:hypothetical protein QBC33DRAFT_536975, partial [Phialemonium atrogriseum]
MCYTYNDTEKISMAPALRMTRSIKEKLNIFFWAFFSSFSQGLACDLLVFEQACFRGAGLPT